jgi:choline kinase
MSILEARESSVIVDSTVPLPEKDFKGKMDGFFIREIGTGIPPAEDVVFLLPVYYLKKPFMEKWMDSISRFVARKETSVYAENAFNEISHSLNLKALDIKGGFCMEVDTIADLEIARERA